MVYKNGVCQCHHCGTYTVCDELNKIWVCEACQKEIPKHNGFIYIIGADAFGYYKIGRSCDPHKRIKSLSTGLPFDLKMLHIIPADNDLDAESQLHERFYTKHIRSEWYKLEAGDIDWLLSLGGFFNGRFLTHGDIIAIQNTATYLGHSVETAERFYAKADDERLDKLAKTEEG